MRNLKRLQQRRYRYALLPDEACRSLLTCSMSQKPGRARLVLLALLASACSKEVRSLDPDQPQSAPTGANDPRGGRFEGNVFQVSQGGRYFTWYGCGSCHQQNADGVRDLADGIWQHGGGVDAVYASIGARHGRYRYAERIPAEQLWQLTAYVRQLSTLPPERRRRQDTDQRGEPQAASWNGPLP
jgi:cytochrome c oxidase cbb3-type subunit 3